MRLSKEEIKMSEQLIDKNKIRLVSSSDSVAIRPKSTDRSHHSQDRQESFASKKSHTLEPTQQQQHQNFGLLN